MQLTIINTEGFLERDAKEQLPVTSMYVQVNKMIIMS